MIRSPKVYHPLLLVLLIVILTGCELSRSEGENEDLAPVSELPPTLAPLGADSEELSGEATAIPTVINVQATATESPLGEGDAAVNPEEPVSPTTQAIDLAPSGGNSAEAETESVSPETFTAPAVESASQESIVVDAPTNDLPAGGPVAANPPTSQTDPVTYSGGAYTVQPGDTLFSIGLAYGVSAQEIMYANGLSSDIIYTGQALTIPTGGTVTDYSAPPVAFEQPAYGAPAANVGGGSHLVGPGETLYSIALNYGTSVDAIAGANGIPYPYVIQVGQQLGIPSPGAYVEPPPPPAEGYYQQPGQDSGYYPQGPNDGYYPAPDNNYGAPGGVAGTHTVSPGETLYMIAQRYGVSAEMIAGANGLSNPNQIYVGQVLYLP